ncbi:hypothetical protein BC833DRAFT_612591 [Globomyces pollinis-pini]|nr:hypothetical protein BC833DRAFT_612591 [Globomyces pollinis-pini]
MDHHGFLLQQIERYQALGENGCETNTTAIANTLLDFGNKTPRNGYIIRDECIMKAMSTVVLTVSENLGADKPVHQEVDHPSRNSVNLNEKPILVIECKHHNNLNESFKEEDFHQITQYILSYKLPIGILLSEFKVVIIKASFSERLPIFKQEKELNLPEDNQILLDYINEL